MARMTRSATTVSDQPRPPSSSERDGFYLATVSETGWPYVQFRGGPPGFLRVLDETTLGYADLRGNRQYVTVGNAQANDRVSLFLMDYAHQRRLKIFGRLRFVDAAEDPQLAARAERCRPSGNGGAGGAHHGGGVRLELPTAHHAPLHAG